MPAPPAYPMRTWLEKVELALWVGLFALTPLIIAPWAYESFLFPKILWAETLIVALACVAILLSLLGRPLVLPMTPVLAILPLYALLHAASIAWAQSPSLALDQSRLWLLLAVASLLFPSTFLGHARRQRLLGAALLLSAAATAAWALSDDIRQAFFPATVDVVNKLGDWRGFIHAGFGNTSHIGDFLALLYPLGFLVFLYAQSRIVQMRMLLWLWLCYAALIAVFSVHSNAGLVMAMIVVLGGVLREGGGQRGFKKFIPRVLALAAGWILIALFFSFDLPGNPHRPGIFHEALGSSRLAFGWDSRVFIWLTGLEIVTGNVWLGVGSGNFTFAFPRTISDLVMANPDLQWMAGSWTNAAHNSLLQAWAEVGIAGPALLVILAVLAFRALGKAAVDHSREGRVARLGALGALAAFAMHAQMNFPLQMAPAMLMLVLIVDVAAMAPLPVAELLPLRLQYGWGSFSALLAPPATPRQISVELNPRPLLAAVAGVIVCMPLLAAQLYFAGSRLAADIVYRQAHEANAQWMNSFSEGDAEQADALFRRALELWPDHHNARSEFSEFLVRQGRNEEALRQVSLTLERLQAWELFLRRGRALWQMGRGEEARRSVDEAFSRRPVEGLMRPRLAAWAAGQDIAPPSPPMRSFTEAWGLADSDSF